MQVIVYVSATLRGFVNRNAKIEAEGETVKDIITFLKVKIHFLKVRIICVELLAI